jgi:tetratricopeptide (TPR) repeat protein/transglutaminase-like putative cysteine protease
MRRWIFVALLASVSAAAQASEKPLYQAVPDWVKPAPAINADNTDAQAPATVVYDNQIRMEGGTVWTYLDTATRVATSQMLGQIGTLKLPWNPSRGDLIIHKLEIIRGAEHIDLIKGGDPFTILRREEQIDQRQLDGVLTATLAVNGLAVGDVLHLVLSTTIKDPTLKGDVQAIAPLVSAPARAGFARVRMIWPTASDVRWRAYAAGISAVPTTVGAYRELLVPLPLAKQPDIPTDAPARYQKLPMIEATSFKDWRAVADVMTPLYRSEGLIAQGSPLAGEVARIKAAESDPVRRTALALQLVQDKIRYLLMGMDTGNYVPQTPAHTWDVRYGDCKAKTLLLLAILHDLDIQAVPVLANIGLGGLVQSRLPGVGAFNHVFVRATIGGRDYWLDGTGAGARLAAIGDVPDFGTVLPLDGTNALLALPRRANALADVEVTLDLDNSAALKLPTLVHARIVAHGGTAEAMNVVANQAVGEERDNFIQSAVNQFVGETLIGTSSLRYDPVTATAVVEATGIVTTKWQRSDGQLRQDLDGVVQLINFTPDRARPEWRDIPVVGPSGISVHRHVTIDVPVQGKGFTIAGDRTLPPILAGAVLSRSVAVDGGRIIVDERIDGLGAEVAPADIARVRTEFAQVSSRTLRAIAPADHPQYYEEIAAATRAGKVKPYEAFYAQAVARSPKEPEAYASRAAFRFGVFDWNGAIEDYTKVIAIRPTPDLYLSRAYTYSILGQDAKQLADINAALEIDPSSDNASGALISFKANHGDAAGAVALAQSRIDLGGESRVGYQMAKAQAQADGGDVAGGVATMDAAIAAKPGDPSLLNARCWLKGTRATALDTALKDCTKSIELSENAAAALDSRAMVYYRMNRYDEAMADLAAAIEASGGQMGSVYLRGIVRQKLGKDQDAAADFALVKLVSPNVPKDYAKFGVKPD